MYNDPTIIIIIILAVLAGGLVKGTLGFGMPMVALPIIAFIIPPTTAMILLCAPIFLTNFLQIKFRQGVSSYRFLPMFLSLIIGLIIGARLILEIDVNTITQIIAVSIIFAALVNCFGIKIKNINKNHENTITSLIGFGSGILGGLSTFYGPPMLAYLVAVDLPKEKFVRTVSTMYFIGSFPLYGSLIYYGFATKEDLIFSLILIIPAFIAQQVGTKIRDKFNQKQFRICILITLIILGFSLLVKTL
ncbi:sulfite exporter TauE/SafE family protein [Alphaproteobacteria bacterium]|nr:sulfite exporter TauE/SafE family protein [Alphaproteobacteria bacterium]MDA7546024.1 sulfite exporter TauE/SafE family protein [Alphaproteobacteria bacterium]MDA9565063.1 sulfite exporter TauE/SafE family protein [Alphaproteobacteria bacterium]MDC0543750.1 sulfite exporter TauE/SafE family protein [Alphaproteobacteria bacterium]